MRVLLLLTGDASRFLTLAHGEPPFQPGSRQFGRASVLWGTRSAPCGSAPPGHPRRKCLGL